jgi:hypothetical protein
MAALPIPEDGEDPPEKALTVFRAAHSALQKSARTFRALSLLIPKSHFRDAQKYERALDGIWPFYAHMGESSMSV